MKKIIYVALLTLLLVGFYMAINGKFNRGVEAQAGSCPKGQFQAGSINGLPICRIEPTGCPYADQIPKDSPKCKPPKSMSHGKLPYVNSNVNKGALK